MHSSNLARLDYLEMVITFFSVVSGFLHPMTDEISENIFMTPEVNRVFDILSKTLRRQALFAIREGIVDNDADLLMRGSRKEEEVRLRHNHLPKLEQAGYIEWDRDTGSISEGPNFDEIKPILELLETHADELPPGWP